MHPPDQTVASIKLRAKVELRRAACLRLLRRRASWLSLPLLKFIPKVWSRQGKERGETGEEEVEEEGGCGRRGVRGREGGSE